MDFSEINIDIANAKPFLKWAGGKTQLIESIANFLPKNIETFDTYIEPFVGSGAVMFWFLKQYP
ncbi:MAG: DNA adenine methylase, partial [Tannerellaceae bacterium]|nr:DNA adenine methylase [Tannerellaceae bacterium]